MLCHSLGGNSVEVTNPACSNSASVSDGVQALLGFFSRCLLRTPPSETEIWGFRNNLVVKVANSGSSQFMFIQTHCTLSLTSHFFQVFPCTLCLFLEIRCCPLYLSTLPSLLLPSELLFLFSRPQFTYLQLSLRFPPCPPQPSPGYHPQCDLLHPLCALLRTLNPPCCYCLSHTSLPHQTLRKRRTKPGCCHC